MKKNPIALVMALTMLLTGCGIAGDSDPVSTEAGSTTAALSSAASFAISTAAASTAATVVTTSPNGAQSVNIQYKSRPNLLAAHYSPVEVCAKPAQKYLTPNADLSNVDFNGYRFTVPEWQDEPVDFVSKEQEEMLKKNGFYVDAHCTTSEFFEFYESNRYENKANYITVDSMVHTYHLYFAHLLKSLEKGELSKELNDVAKAMMKNAQAHLDELKGTEWEKAAKIELAFFTVGAFLLDEKTAIPADVKQMVEDELEKINRADGIDGSAIFSDPYAGFELVEDYTQYKPRGYYTESEQLQKYFKAMMWFGRIGFCSDEDLMVRAGVLTTLSMTGEALEKWEHIYTVTSFFAGQAEDLSYYEFMPAIEALYGKGVTAKNLVGDYNRWAQFMQAVRQMPSPQINTVPVDAAESDEEAAAAQKGFRFMGQRFTLDASIFTQLVYRQIKENADGEQRLLPTALDFPAALGNETALQIIKDEGKANYPNYMENMNKVRQTVKDAPESTWNSSLCASWIYTLLPTIEEKDSAYPPFMLTEAWKNKALSSFEGSYTELKHDTVLYVKQVMGEMGGGGPVAEDADDRGYVEVEPVVFGRLKAMIDATAAGLSDFDMISAKDKENLSILSQLAGKLETIANKELAKELPTKEEFDLIRSYGGQLEHFWEEVMKADFPDEAEYITPMLHPAALVTDIATDPNGRCLQAGTGNPIEIGVLVEVDGKLKLATGAVFSYYEFEQPLGDRMTDNDWQARQGFKYDSNSKYNWDKYNNETEFEKNKISLPEWTDSFIVKYKNMD